MTTKIYKYFQIRVLVTYDVKATPTLIILTYVRGRYVGVSGTSATRSLNVDDLITTLIYSWLVG